MLGTADLTPRGRLRQIGEVRKTRGNGMLAGRNSIPHPPPKPKPVRSNCWNTVVPHLQKWKCSVTEAGDLNQGMQEFVDRIRNLALPPNDLPPLVDYLAATPLLTAAVSSDEQQDGLDILDGVDIEELEEVCVER